jgi:hypothetical protein
MAAEINSDDGGSWEHPDPQSPDAVWYVADEETQVGPMTAAEVEERCRSGQLDAMSMVWSSGMPDWLPLAEVPELAHLASGPAERPTDDVTWSPISADELGALAAAVAPAPAVESAPRAAAPELPAGFGDPAPGWSVPAPRPAPAPPVDTKSRAPLVYAVGLAGAAFVGAFAALFFVYEVAPPARVAPGVSDGTRPHSDGPAQGSGGHELASSPVAQPATGPTEQPRPVEEPAPASEKEKEVVDPCAAVRCSGHGRCVVRGDHARCRCDDGFRNAGPTRCVEKPTQTPPPALPDKASIMAVVVEHKSELRPCLARAKKPASVEPGQYPLVLSWMILPDGSVGQVRVRRPEWARQTTLPACFAAVMRKWKFPAPGRDFAVNNFPLGNVNLK